MNENTLSSNLERIKDATDSIRQTFNMPNNTIEEVAQAVAHDKIKGVKYIVRNEYELNHISNPQIGDVAVVNNGPEEIEWDNPNINSNILIFPNEVMLPEEYEYDEAALIITDVTGAETVHDYNSIRYSNNAISCELEHDGIELTVEYIYSNNHYILNSLIYKINNVVQTVENNTVYLPFMIVIDDTASVGTVDFNCVKNIVHTYKVMPYDYFYVGTNRSLMFPKQEFTLSQAVTENYSGLISETDSGDDYHWSLTPQNFTIEIPALDSLHPMVTINYTSNDGIYYVYDDTSDVAYNVWNQPYILVYTDESAVTPSGILGEIFSYTPKFYLAKFKRNNDGWQLYG